MRTIRGYDPNGNDVFRDSTSAEDGNTVNLANKAQTALAANDTFLALASPTQSSDARTSSAP